jgi:hypothetical protein
LMHERPHFPSRQDRFRRVGNAIRASWLSSLGNASGGRAGRSSAALLG